MKRITSAAVALLMAAGMLEAGEVGTMTTFTAGTPAVANEVNANFNEHTAQINDNNSRISANSDAIAASGLVGWNSLAVSINPSAPDVSATFGKIGDMGTYTKQIDSSILDVQFNGRICAEVITADAVIFELRVDDTPATAGRARALIRYGEEGCFTGIPAAISGIFENLPAGTHTVSMWAKVNDPLSDAKGLRYNPGNWEAAHLLIKEFGIR